MSYTIDMWVDNAVQPARQLQDDNADNSTRDYVAPSNEIVWSKEVRDLELDVWLIEELYR